jgi:hypothetical protein
MPPPHSPSAMDYPALLLATGGHQIEAAETLIQAGRFIHPMPVGQRCEGGTLAVRCAARCVKKAS